MEFLVPLHDENTVFQAEIVEILKAADLIRDRGICNRNISIYTDSQAALKALQGTKFRSQVALTCVNKLNEIGITNNLKIVWVPGHQGHVGNEHADQLARDGSPLPQHENAQLYKIPLSSVILKIEEKVREESTTRLLN